MARASDPVFQVIELPDQPVPCVSHQGYLLQVHVSAVVDHVFVVFKI